MERKGLIPKKEPVYTVTGAEMVKAALKGPGKAAMNREINAQLLEADKRFTLDVDSMVLSTLHHEYGWGPKRCKDFYVRMFRHHMEMRKFYEIDDLYPERYKLKEAGIDVEAWYNALFDDNGNFKDPEDISL
jgi:hypothetical protein